MDLFDEPVHTCLTYWQWMGFWITGDDDEKD